MRAAEPFLVRDHIAYNAIAVRSIAYVSHPAVENAVTSLKDVWLEVPLDHFGAQQCG
jgi:hypothetical protein